MIQMLRKDLKLTLPADKCTAKSIFCNKIAKEGSCGLQRRYIDDAIVANRTKTFSLIDAERGFSWLISNCRSVVHHFGTESLKVQGST